jgi:hypothetical protein
MERAAIAFIWVGLGKGGRHYKRNRTASTRRRIAWMGIGMVWGALRRVYTCYG